MKETTVPDQPRPGDAHGPPLMADTDTETLAAWLDDLADACEGEPSNMAWNLQVIAKRLRASVLVPKPWEFPWEGVRPKS